MGHNPLLEMPVSYYLRRAQVTRGVLRPVQEDPGSVTAFLRETVQRLAGKFPKTEWSGLLWAVWDFEHRPTRTEARPDSETRRPDKLITLPASVVFRLNISPVLPSLDFRN